MLHDVAIFLAAAVIAVPLSRRLGLGAVIGYLIAGIVIGPWALRLITDVGSILDFSQFGVVLLLFVIGLELQPSRLWRLKAHVLGLGGAQVLVTTLAIAALMAAGTAGWTPALIAGFGLAMSSTAFTLQLLTERNELTTRHGRSAFAILLFQDLAVIPFLALVPMLTGSAEHALSGPAVFKAAVFIFALIAFGRFALRPALNYLAATNVPEIFTAAALLVVVATSLGMQAVGLSASLGAFVAGMLLADSEYRHEIQADIEPFKGLLLGLFFIAVGMSVNLGVLAERPLYILGGVAALIAVKAAILFLLGRISRLPADASRALAVALAQGGEFAFVLFGLAADAGLIAVPMQQELVLMVTLSMMVTPPLYSLQARFRRDELVGPAYDTIDADAVPVLVAGFGPFGQIIGRLLRLKKIRFTVLEKNWEQVDFVRRFGNRIYYGDAARVDLLKAAQADKAQIFVISIANTDISMQIAETVRRHFPHLRIFAVANDRYHAMRLMDLGINDYVRRAYFSSLELARRLLHGLGLDEAQVERDIAKFREHDEKTLLRQQAVYRDETKLIQTAQDAARELEQLFEADVGAGPSAPMESKPD